MKYKPFDEKIFLENDPPSRKYIMSYMSASGFIFIENPDKYGVDLLLSGSSTGLELEHRTMWDNGPFPFEMVNIPARKLKYFNENNNSYCVINKSYTQFGICISAKIKKYVNNIHENPNHTIPEGEYFIKIPRVEFKWIKFQNN